MRAFDVRTGKRLWTFNTIPRPGEFGNDTWLNDSWAVNGNTGVWNQMAVDEELGLAYLPVETPSSDFYGGHRPGNNLFAESLVAVDLKTGKRRWHFQLVHHPLWNMDIATAPMLVDITVDGQPIKAVAIMGKQAWIYVFDRVTGQPVLPIEERPVPQGDVPGEWYSPTQPFPDQAAALRSPGRHGRQPDRLHAGAARRSGEAAVALQARADLHAAARQQGGRSDRRLPIVGRHELAGRLVRSRDARRLRAVVHVARAARAAAAAEQGVLGRRLRAWAPRSPASATSRDPARTPAPMRAPPARSEAQTARTGDGAGNINPQGLPFLKPPYGRITAIDLDRGEFLWQVAHGETPDNVRNHPALKGLNIPRTGQSGAVGALVTKTLVDRRASRRRRRSPDRPRGRDAARLRQGDRQGSRRGVHAGAAERHADDLQLNGKQYIVVAVSGGNYSGEYLAFALAVGLPRSRFPDTIDHDAVRQRNRQRDAILGSEISRDVALARRVLDQVDVSGTGEDMDAAGDLDFRAPRQRDHELSRRARCASLDRWQRRPPCCVDSRQALAAAR